MERFIPVENFRKKGNTFRGISFFPLLPEFPKISVPFAHSYSARLFTVILPRKNAKDLTDGGRFPKRLSLQCVSLLVGSVGKEHNCSPAGENELSFLVGTFLHDSDSSVLSPELHREKKVWMLIAGSPDECECCSSQKTKLSPSSPKKYNFLSRPIKRLARQEVQPPCFFLTWYVPRPRPTGIRKFRSNDTVQSISFR